MFIPTTYDASITKIIVLEYDQTNQTTDYWNKVMKGTLNDKNSFYIYFRLKYQTFDRAFVVVFFVGHTLPEG